MLYKPHGILPEIKHEVYIELVIHKMKHSQRLVLLVCFLLIFIVALTHIRGPGFDINKTTQKSRDYLYDSDENRINQIDFEFDTRNLSIGVVYSNGYSDTSDRKYLSYIKHNWITHKSQAKMKENLWLNLTDKSRNKDYSEVNAFYNNTISFPQIKCSKGSAISIIQQCRLHTNVYILLIYGTIICSRYYNKPH